MPVESGLKRPWAVRVGVPYLAALWLFMVGVVLMVSDGFGDGSALGLLFWTVIWLYALLRVWWGGPLAIAAVSLLTILLPALSAGGSVIVLGLLWLAGEELTGLGISYWVSLLGAATAVAVGVSLRQESVKEWSLAINPPNPLHGGGDDDVTASAALRLEALAGRPLFAMTDAELADLASETGVSAARREPPDPAVTVDQDLGNALVAQARGRVGCFALLLAPFWIGALAATIGLALGNDDWPAVLGIWGFIAAVLLASWVSYLRFRRRLGPGSQLKVDDRGITWEVPQEGRAESWSWDDLAGVGISYRTVQTKGGQKTHMPQLEIFERSPTHQARSPLLAGRLRTEEPPVAGLPQQRYRLMLPVSGELHQKVDHALRSHAGERWLGWYQRRRSDTPWLLR